MNSAIILISVITVASAILTIIALKTWKFHKHSSTSFTF